MTSRRPLEILGIDELEERVYRTLLATGWATIQELAREVSLTWCGPGRKMACR